MTYTTNGPEETKTIATTVAATLKGGELIFLIGDLGAGKTTFVQGLAAALGANTRVTSPTFSIMNEYPCSKGSIRRLVHLDLYRFTDASELSALALEDEKRPDTVIVIEWPNAIEGFPWTPDVTVTFLHEGEDRRTIEVT